ncbi:J domain-containing protein [Haloechinothrix salitolerans]|uniref:J domain-containing protein n=1 Tax=Haloechinothrix salitolerans TaxID=926830 RepID=A0ABW2C3Q0_9PSEU
MDDDTARRVLGISPHATREQARAAYKRRAKMIHPDRHANTSNAARHEAERAMAELNEAWRALRSGTSTPGDTVRQAANRERSTEDHVAARHDRARRPRDRECEICGYTPAVWIDIRALTGLIILHSSDRYAATLCKNCGTAIWRDVQARTLTLGWWGIPALFVNLAVLVNNRGYGASLRELAPPTARVADSPAPMSEPMSVTKPVTARVLPWLATISVVAIIVLVAIAAVRVRG